MPKYKAHFLRRDLHFKKPAGTSRGYLTEKPDWFIFITDQDSRITGTGECSIIPGLSIDDRPDYEEKLKAVCGRISNSVSINFHNFQLEEFPSIQFGIETALLDLQNGGKALLFDIPFSHGQEGIPINGLIWMGSFEEMWEQVPQKVEAGYSVIKLKIGALDFEKELRLLEKIRQNYAYIELRLDANGAFSPEQAMEKLKTLSQFNIHSIEQPIKAGQWQTMADLCSNTPIPIALDEELIGVNFPEKKRELLDAVKPQYIILKPSLIGGLAASDEWIRLAEERNIGWWATSALESNIGLNAIAQWTASKKPVLPQGLGTGSLYTNNIESGLYIEKGKLYLNSAQLPERIF